MALLHVAYLIVIAGLVAVIVLREFDFRRVSREKDAVITQLRELFTGLVDRLYEKKNLAPTGVNLNQVYEQRQQVAQERRVERRNGGPVQLQPKGPVDSAVLAMEMDVRRREVGPPK